MEMNGYNLIASIQKLPTLECVYTLGGGGGGLGFLGFGLGVGSSNKQFFINYFEQL